MSAPTPNERRYSRPVYLMTGFSDVTWARLRFLNKIQELVPEFMVPLRDEIFPLWVSCMFHRRDLEANELVHKAVTRLNDWLDDFQIGGYVFCEVLWQFQRWQESEPGTPLPLRFERESEIAETQIGGCYPFEFVPTLDIEEEPVPECVDRIRPEAYKCSRDYAKAVYSVIGARGVWKQSPDHAELDRNCELLVRYQVTGEQPEEIAKRITWPMTAEEIVKSNELLTTKIVLKLREIDGFRRRPRPRICKEM